MLATRTSPRKSTTTPSFFGVKKYTYCVLFFAIITGKIVLRETCFSEILTRLQVCFSGYSKKVLATQ